MSDEIPFHIQEEIMTRLPVKSLVRFRSVSKAWKSLIESSEFISAHSLRSHTQQQHLLVSYEDRSDEEHYVCYVDDNTFPRQRSLPTLPLSIKQFELTRVVGSSQGLFCLYGFVPDLTSIAILWNLSIRKSIVIVLPNPMIIGFGVCPVTNDPKIIVIARSQDLIITEVMVYTLSLGKWKSLSSNLLNKPIRATWWSPVVTDTFIYWNDYRTTGNRILSFDVTNESFEVIDIPDSLACKDLGHFYISKIRGSLAMLQYRDDDNICSVWTMEHGVQRTYTKLFTIKTTGFIVGFRKSGVPFMIVGKDDDDDELTSKLVYEPNSEYNDVLENSEPSPMFNLNVNAFIETLLLLDRSI